MFKEGTVSLNLVSTLVGKLATCTYRPLCNTECHIYSNSTVTFLTFLTYQCKQASWNTTSANEMIML